MYQLMILNRCLSSLSVEILLKFFCLLLDQLQWQGNVLRDFHVGEVLPWLMAFPWYVNLVSFWLKTSWKNFSILFLFLPHNGKFQLGISVVEIRKLVSWILWMTSTLVFKHFCPCNSKVTDMSLFSITQLYLHISSLCLQF